MNRLTLTIPLAALCLLLSTAAPAGRDRDGNPPGPIGGRGSNWENPPGLRGGPGSSPDRRDWIHAGTRERVHQVRGGDGHAPGRRWIDFDHNPPGPVGGRGTNWENPPGRRGGPGASPDRYGRCR